MFDLGWVCCLPSQAALRISPFLAGTQARSPRDTTQLHLQQTLLESEGAGRFSPLIRGTCNGSTSLFPYESSRIQLTN